jgi:cytochrome c-type biogenesis protein CcmF
MASLGYYLLLAAFVVSAYAATMSVVGARRRSRALTESGIGAFYLVTAIMAVASALIVHAFVTGNYSIKYVFGYSDSALPLFFRLTSYWGGLDGSIMFWVTLLASFGTVAVYVNRERYRELIPYVVAVISGVQMFFLYLMMLHNNPFETFLTQQPADGNGLNPLLQNFYMVIHPPTMYLGFVGITIPFAFGIAALITGYLDDSWLRAVRRWTMFAWLFLTIGLCLGMLWAYEELGWGGVWMWDPVENAGLLPWFTATAFLHSVMVQERRGMLRVWNVSLIVLTFFLTIFGTFMTRSGVVQSVHSFGENPELSRLFVIFMVVLLTFSFGLIIYRLPLLRARNELDSWASREAAFLANNWILLFSAFFVLFATMFPTLSEALGRGRITIATVFFNKWMLPVGLILLMLTGIGPLLAWRKSTLQNLKNQFLFPVLCGTIVGGALVALGVRVLLSSLCFALAGFVMGTVTQEFWRGARVRQQTTGTDLFTALIGLVGRNKRRYGGYIVHVGVVFIFLGLAGAGFKLSEEATLLPGQQVQVGDYIARFDSLRVDEDSLKQAITANVSVLRDGEQLATVYPAKWNFHKSAQPTTEVAILRGITEDFYVVLTSYDAANQQAGLTVSVNPLINWIWVGFGMVAFGTIIALLPDTVFAFAVNKVPAAATTAMLLVGLLAWPAAAAAQQPQSGTTGELVHKSAMERELENEIQCTCGGCRSSIKECPMMNCHGDTAQTAKLRELIDEGKTREEILAIYVRDFGSEAVLSRPFDRGFNRLAWLVPYLVAAGALVAVMLTARRWSRPALATPTDSGLDVSMNARLDDELRDLD